MRKRTAILMSVIGGCGLVGTPAADAPRDPNRFSLNGRFTFAVDAEFTSTTPTLDLGVPGAIATTPAQAGTILRTYDDGFIGVDISGNAGSLTTFWSYSDLSQITGLGTAAGTLSFHSAPSPADQFSLMSDDEVLPGFDFKYARDLGSFEMEVNGRPTRAWYGIFVSAGYTDLSLAQRGSVTAPVTLTTDTFAIGAIIPPAPPFQGTVPGPGPIIPDSPAGRAVTTPAATANNRNEVEGSIYGFTVGPFLEIPLSERLIAEFSGGLALALADRNYSFTESVTIAGVPTTLRSGSRDNRDWLFGGVANVALNYQLASRTQLQLGFQYQHLGAARQSVNGKIARIDVGNALSLTFGVNWQY